MLLSAGSLVLRTVTAQTAESSPPPPAVVLTKENIVDVSLGRGAWVGASVGQTLAIHDRIRTGEDSRATVRLSDLTVLRMDEYSLDEIEAPQAPSGKATLNVEQGTSYFFSREKSREFRIQTPAANGATRGTEFVVTVGANGKTTVTMLDGELELSNAQGSVLVHSGEQANAEPGRKPTKTAVIEAINVIQWCLYYPGVLDLNELGFAAARRGSNASLAAYADGDLLAALKDYRGGDGSGVDKVYHAGLLLAVGQVPKANALLRQVSPGTPGREALLTLIAAVTLKPRPNAEPPRTASDWIAESYYRQSKADLPGALEAAQQATAIDSSFGFAWTRVAELQFSFGRIPQSKEALEKGLSLSSRNPAAHSLRGFLFSAENKINTAKRAFEDAMAIDGALGDAWLGHGLCLIRQGKAEDGRRDLQVAAALEPNRSFFHSYLGKAFSKLGNEHKARLELDRAKQLDPKDPTPWLYSAIENRQDNRINEAVRDLETSVALNDNRRIYRSQFLLDQDRAVRSANLAAIYQDDGMEDVSVREATRGVESDYSDASSHLFLANTYAVLRDPNRINLRYETPWFNELLLANLLAPVGGGPLSQYVSEQEYSKLFESDRFGISSTTDYFSTGEIREIASQYGIFGNVSYSLDTEFLYNNGLRPNNEITRSESYAEVKLQLTLQDSIFLQTKYTDIREGDLFQYYDQDSFAPGLHFRELQQPGLLLAGYHHQWAPGVHTLVLVGRLDDEIFFNNLNTQNNADAFLAAENRLFLGHPVALLPNVSSPLVILKDPNGKFLGSVLVPLDLHYHNTFTTYTGELSQIWESDNNTLIFGARFQSGDFHTNDLLDKPVGVYASLFMMPAAEQNFDTSLHRATFYIYDTWWPFRSLSITGGFAYDHLQYPTDYRNPPLLGSESSRDHISPKAGLIWNPSGNLFLRAAYTRSLGGVSFDESVGLEPNQVAGFNQVFRSIISESLAGSVASPTYENAGFLIEDKFPTGTYVGIQGTFLKSDVDRRVGVFDLSAIPFEGQIVPLSLIVPSSTPQLLKYEEENLTLTLNQLVGNEWSFGARYQVAFSDLQTIFKDVPKGPTAVQSVIAADSRQKATLHQGQIFALYNHPSGFFGSVEGYWAQQSNVGYFPDEPGDNIFQLNAYVGYRLRRNFGDLTLGFLNLNDQDYKLNPLNYYNELPRHRTLLVRVRLSF